MELSKNASHSADSAEVNLILRKALVRLFVNQPENPMEFLANYFEWECDQSNPLSRAHQLLLEVHHSHLAFDENLREAYITISQHKAHKKLKGLTGDIFKELLSMLCRFLSEPLERKMISNLRVHESQVVTYAKFRNGVYVCLVLKDAAVWFTEFLSLLGVDGKSKLTKAVCECIVNLMDEVCKGPFQGSRIPERMLIEHVMKLIKLFRNAKLEQGGNYLSGDQLVDQLILSYINATSSLNST